MIIGPQRHLAARASTGDTPPLAVTEAEWVFPVRGGLTGKRCEWVMERIRSGGEGSLRLFAGRGATLTYSRWKIEFLIRGTRVRLHVRLRALRGCGECLGMGADWLLPSIIETALRRTPMDANGRLHPAVPALRG